MYKLSIVFSFLTIFLVTRVHSQAIGIDIKSESVFTYYTMDESRISFSGDGNLAYTFRFRARSLPYVTKDNVPTVAKQKALTFSTVLNTSEELFSFTKGGKLRPGIEFKFGKHITIDSFLDGKIKNVKYSIKTWGLDFVAGADNVKIYDPIKLEASKKYPISIGAEGYFNFVFVNRGKLEDKSIRLLVALTGSVKHTWNDDELISYQKLSNLTAISPVVALEDFEGRYGILRRDIWKSRFSVSLPLYYGHFNPIPYLATVFQTNGTPLYYSGLFTNYLIEKLDPHRFLLPSASLGVGIGFKTSNNNWTDPIFYIKGDINIGPRK